MNHALTLSQPQALLQLNLMQAEAPAATFEAFAAEAARSDLPAELLTRLKPIWTACRRIGTEVIEVGKIVLVKVLEFLRAHPAIQWGLLLGAAVSLLVAAIPFLGAVLAPLISFVGPFSGMALGASVDAGELPTDLLGGMYRLAQRFFGLMLDVFVTLRERWSGEASA